VKAARGVLLDNEDLVVFACFLPARLGRLRKTAFATVFGEFSHLSHYRATHTANHAELSDGWTVAALEPAI
jgi:hypothetical protein